MPTTVTIVLRKEFADDCKFLNCAAEGWEVDGWLMAGAEFRRRPPVDATHTLHEMLLLEIMSERARADAAEQKLAGLGPNE